MWWIVIILIVAVAIVIPILICFGARDNKANKSNHHKSETTPAPVSAKDFAGEWGEEAVYYCLKPLLADDEYLLPNILLPLKNGYTTEIDSILISRKGIFCIEAKKWVGIVVGSDEDEYWYQKYDAPYKRDKQHINPVKQNQAHCDILKKLLHNKYHIDNIVIFVELKSGRYINSECAFTIKDFKEFYEILDNELSPSQVKSICQQLLPYVATDEKLAKHKEEMNGRFN